MRHIDIQRLRHPNGWPARSTRALNNLKNEIAIAEAQARQSGADHTHARRRAVADGLKLHQRQRIWRDMAIALARLSNSKCWYSESQNPTSDKNVDHFRPKASVADDPLHEGYWWLAFHSANYRYASQWCNQRRHDRINGTSGGKADIFPLQEGSFRASQETDDIRSERPLLLDPINPEDCRLLTFRTDGRPVPTAQPGTFAHERAQVSIDAYHLHCHPLVTERRAVAARIERVVKTIDLAVPKLASNDVRTIYQLQLKELLCLINHNAAYSAAALAYAREHLYTISQGRQVKRTWLSHLLKSQR